MSFVFLSPLALPRSLEGHRVFGAGGGGRSMLVSLCPGLVGVVGAAGGV